MEFFRELRQDQRLKQAQISADSAGKRAEAGESVVRDLQETVDKLSLVCVAMWSLMQEKTGLTEEDLLQRVQQMDLADGVADGKVTNSARPCPQCGRTISARYRRCMYCGYQFQRNSAFDAL